MEDGDEERWRMWVRVRLRDEVGWRMMMEDEGGWRMMMMRKDGG